MKAIILAGGSGSRLWPLSREMTPKQLMKIDTKYSLLQSALIRLKNFKNIDEIIAISNIKNYSDVKLQLSAIDSNVKIIAEPATKNTAPAIASGITYYKNMGYEDTVLIVPSDHLINDEQTFVECINAAIPLTEHGYIVTFGVKPEYPETGYGYIKINDKLNNGFSVDKFVEKPNLNQAENYVSNTDYYWNCGIYMTKISTIIDEYTKHCSQIYEAMRHIDFSNSLKIDYSIYENLPSISIDYAIIEKTSRLVMKELTSDWKDVGSWQSLYEVKRKDNEGNVLDGNVITNNVKNSLIYSQKELVAVSGLEDIILVETEDAIMACNRNNAQDVKILYEKLKETCSETIQLHKTMFRPWGYYTCLSRGEGYLTKTICVMPKQKLSLQSHNHRSEHWVVLEGTAAVILEDKEYIVNAGDSIDIPLKAKHSLQNPYDNILKIIEVQKGDYISEDDIVRYDDIYGRV